MHPAPAEQAIGVHVLADRAARAVVRIHKQAEGRPARQGFEPQRARSGVQVDHPRLMQTISPGGVLQHVEDRLTRPIRGRPRVLPFGRDDGAPLQTAGYDAHGSTAPARAAATAAARRLAPEGFAPKRFAAARTARPVARALAKAIIGTRIGTPAGAARAAERLIAGLPARTTALGRAATVVDELVRARFARLERAARTLA